MNSDCLPGFIADYNARFAKLPANPKDLHRAMGANAPDESSEAQATSRQDMRKANCYIHTPFD